MLAASSPEAAPPTQQSVTFRPFALADEPKILELFEIVFHSTMSAEHWRWQFPDNPFSRPIVYVAETSDGRLIGHYSLIPLPFVKNKKPGLAALSIQSMIHPDFQKRGILKSLAAAAERQLDEDKILTGVTFLNDNSLHAYTTHFGWTKLEGPNPIFFTVLDPKAAMKKVLKSELVAAPLAWAARPVFDRVFRRKARAAGPRIHEVKRFDERVDQLWNRFSAEARYAVPRSARYLNWRLADKPADYSLFVSEDEKGEIEGVVVTKTETKFGLYFGYVVELFFDPARPEIGRALVGHALSSLQAQGCTMATALTHGSDAVRRALRSSGFWRLPKKAMPHGIHFCFKDRERGGPGLSQDGWLLSYCDHDVV